MFNFQIPCTNLNIMNIFKKLLYNNKLNKIFTPNTVAELTYVKRPVLETDLEKYLSLPGKQIVVYGHSGGGKTTLLRNKLRDINQNYIKTHCESTSTFNDLLLQAFDELNRFYVSEKSANSEKHISNQLKTEYTGISNQIISSQKESTGSKSVRVVPPQLTPQKLAKFLGEIGCIWIIEDFHKVTEEEKKRIADVVKIFIDAANDYDKVKIICIGAVGTARELIELDNNLSNRVAELFVPLMNDQQIESIVTKGFDLLNVTIDDKLKEKIVYYSNNLASITHQICYDLCFHSDIKRMKFFRRKLKSNAFLIAINSYVRKNSDTFAKVYDAIACLDYGSAILRTFDDLEKDALSFTEIKENIIHKNKLVEEELSQCLELLGSTKHNYFIRYDGNSKKYSISSPFFHAFLKMRFALEYSEQKAIFTKRNKKKDNKFVIDNSAPVPNFERREIVFNEELLVTYHQYLEEIMIKEMKLKIQQKHLASKGKNDTKG